MQIEPVQKKLLNLGKCPDNTLDRKYSQIFKGSISNAFSTVLLMTFFSVGMA